MSRVGKIMIKDVLKLGLQLAMLLFLVIGISMLIHYNGGKDIAPKFAIFGGIIVGLVQLWEVRKIVKKHL
jgi:hypothetical protein